MRSIYISICMHNPFNYFSALRSYCSRFSVGLLSYDSTTTLMRLDRGENLDGKTRPHFPIYLNIRADKAQGLYSTLCMQLELPRLLSSISREENLVSVFFSLIYLFPLLPESKVFTNFIYFLITNFCPAPFSEVSHQNLC